VSTIAIVLIAIGVIALLAVLYFALWSPQRRAEKRLAAERERAAGRHRELASERHSRASVAEQQAEEARLQATRAEQEAQLAREEASVHEGQADLHDQGLADHQLETETANPDEPTTPIDRPDRLSDRTGEPVQQGRFARDSVSEESETPR
jgi:FtsZ-interacting cell division protein ZipA